MQTLTVSTLQGPKKSTFSEKQVVSQTETGPPGPNSRLEGKSICDVLMVEIFARSARLTKACRHMGCRSVAVDKTTNRSLGTKILCVMLQTLRIWICWSSFYKQKYKTWAGCILPQLAEQHQKPGKSQTVRGTASFWNDLVRTQAANQVYEVTAQLARLLISWGVFCHH